MICAILCLASLTTNVDDVSVVVLFMFCKHVLICFNPHTGLTENLLQKQLTDNDEVVEKLFSEVSGLEDFPKLRNPQVDTSV